MEKCNILQFTTQLKPSEETILRAQYLTAALAVASPTDPLRTGNPAQHLVHISQLPTLHSSRSTPATISRLYTPCVKGNIHTSIHLCMYSTNLALGVAEVGSSSMNVFSLRPLERGGTGNSVRAAPGAWRLVCWKCIASGFL